MYVTITRTRACIIEYEGGIEFLGLKECLSNALRVLIDEGTVVIDEFQRLPEDYWDLIRARHGEAKGRLILCGSSLGVARKVFNRRSPLLGLLEPALIDLASSEDTIISLAKHLRPKEAILWAVIAREPWILSLVRPEGKPWRNNSYHKRSKEEN